jgi:hypothetical protein
VSAFDKIAAGLRDAIRILEGDERRKVLAAIAKQKAQLNTEDKDAAH